MGRLHWFYPLESKLISDDENISFPLEGNKMTVDERWATWEHTALWFPLQGRWPLREEVILNLMSTCLKGMRTFFNWHLCPSLWPSGLLKQGTSSNWNQNFPQRSHTERTKRYMPTASQRNNLSPGKKRFHTMPTTCQTIFHAGEQSWGSDVSIMDKTAPWLWLLNYAYFIFST